MNNLNLFECSWYHITLLSKWLLHRVQKYIYINSVKRHGNEITNFKKNNHLYYSMANIWALLKGNNIGNSVY